MQTPALLFAIVVVLIAAPVAAERCDIRYSVRLIHPGHNVDTGSEVRAFSTCVSTLTRCHTHAEELARAHARRTPSAQGGQADAESVEILDIETAEDCEEQTR